MTMDTEVTNGKTENEGATDGGVTEEKEPERVFSLPEKGELFVEE